MSFSRAGKKEKSKPEMGVSDQKLIFLILSSTPLIRSKTKMADSVDPESHQTAETKSLLAKDQQDRDDENATIWDDVRKISLMAIPIFLSMASFTGMKVTDSALLGHSSADALAAASLSDLVWTSIAFSIRHC